MCFFLTSLSGIHLISQMCLTPHVFFWTTSCRKFLKISDSQWEPKRNRCYQLILLMEEILQHLGSMKPCNQMMGSTTNLNWYRISAINSRQAGLQVASKMHKHQALPARPRRPSSGVGGFSQTSRLGHVPVL